MWTLTHELTASFFVPKNRWKGEKTYEKEMHELRARCTRSIKIVVNRRL